jgi:hypothetical protein
MGRTKGERGERPGPVSEFPGKLRDKVINFTAPQELHDILDDAMLRTGRTRSEVLCRLIADHGKKVKAPKAPKRPKASQSATATA